MKGKQMKSICFSMIILAAVALSGCSKKEPTSQPKTPTTTEQQPAEPQAAPVTPTEEATPAAPATAAPKEAKPVAPPATPEHGSLEEQAAAAIAAEAAKEKPPVAELGQKAASLDGLTMIKGEPVKFQDGKFYVVEFWATWCPPCRKSIPHLTELQKAFKDKGVTFIGISNEKEIEKVKAFVTEQGDKMDYRVAVDTEGKVSEGYMQAYQQNGIPTAFIVDNKGNVAWLGHPMELDDVLEQVVAGTFNIDAYEKAKAERQAAEESLSKLFQEYVNTLMSGATIETSRPIAEKIVATDDIRALMALAWQVTSIPNLDEASRDYEIALKAIEKAHKISNGEDIAVLDVYATVLSKMNKPDEALAMLQKAVEIAADEEETQAYLKQHMDDIKKSQEETAAPTENTETPKAPAAPAE